MNTYMGLFPFSLKNGVGQEKLHWPISLWYVNNIVGHGNSCEGCYLGPLYTHGRIAGYLEL